LRVLTCDRGDERTPSPFSARALTMRAEACRRSLVGLASVGWQPASDRTEDLSGPDTDHARCRRLTRCPTGRCGNSGMAADCRSTRLGARTRSWCSSRYRPRRRRRRGPDHHSFRSLASVRGYPVWRHSPPAAHSTSNSRSMRCTCGRGGPRRPAAYVDDTAC
jgi:hypothetical protein